jgi:hypothetical protein
MINFNYRPVQRLSIDVLQSTGKSVLLHRSKVIKIENEQRNDGPSRVGLYATVTACQYGLKILTPCCRSKRMTSTVLRD